MIIRGSLPRRVVIEDPFLLIAGPKRRIPSCLLDASKKDFSFATDWL
jgi:hypothetical protein